MIVPNLPAFLFLVVLRVDFDEVLPLFRRLVERENRFHGARRNAGAAIDALVGVDEQLLRGLERRFILPRMYAIDRADVDTGGVLRADAGLGDDIRHSQSPGVLAVGYRLRALERL